MESRSSGPRQYLPVEGAQESVQTERLRSANEAFAMRLKDKAMKKKHASRLSSKSLSSAKRTKQKQATIPAAPAEEREPSSERSSGKLVLLRDQADTSLSTRTYANIEPVAWKEMMEAVKSDVAANVEQGPDWQPIRVVKPPRPSSPSRSVKRSMSQSPALSRTTPDTQKTGGSTQSWSRDDENESRELIKDVDSPKSVKSFRCLFPKPQPTPVESKSRKKKGRGAVKKEKPAKRDRRRFFGFRSGRTRSPKITAAPKRFAELTKVSPSKNIAQVKLEKMGESPRASASVQKYYDSRQVTSPSAKGTARSISSKTTKSKASARESASIKSRSSQPPSKPISPSSKSRSVTRGVVPAPTPRADDDGSAVEHILTELSIAEQERSCDQTASVMAASPRSGMVLSPRSQMTGMSSLTGVTQVLNTPRTVHRHEQKRALKVQLEEDEEENSIVDTGDESEQGAQAQRIRQEKAAERRKYKAMIKTHKRFTKGQGDKNRGVAPLVPTISYDSSGNSSFYDQGQDYFFGSSLCTTRGVLKQCMTLNDVEDEENSTGDSQTLPVLSPSMSTYHEDEDELDKLESFFCGF